MDKIISCALVVAASLGIGACSHEPANYPSGETADGNIDLIINGNYVVSMDDAGTV